MVMKGTRLASIAAAAIAPALVFAAPAHADPDVDSRTNSHVRDLRAEDYNAWIGKITCKRLYNGTDLDADKSAKFVFIQLPKAATPSRHGSSSVLRFAHTARQAAGPFSRRATVRRQKC